MSETVVWNDHETPLTSPPKRKHKRVTVPLEFGRSVTVLGGNHSLDGLIEVLEEVLGKARKARQLKLSLKTFLSMLQDQADNADSE